MEEITVRLVDLPPSIGGFVAEDTDGSYSVYINATWGSDAQHRAMLHELRHIANDDLNNGLPIDFIEKSAS